MIITNIDTENDNKLNKSKKTNRFCLALSANITRDTDIRLKSLFIDFSVSQIAASDQFTFGGEKALVIHDGKVPEYAESQNNKLRARYNVLNFLLPSVYFSLEEAKKAGDRLMLIDKEEAFSFEKELFNSYVILDSDKVYLHLRSAPFYFDEELGLTYPAEINELAGVSDDEKLDTLYKLVSAITGKDDLLSYQKKSGSKIKSEIKITLESVTGKDKTMSVFAYQLTTMDKIQQMAAHIRVELLKD